MNVKSMSIQFVKFGDTNRFVFGKDGSICIYIEILFIYVEDRLKTNQRC